jgi:hypothetical protein
MDTLVPISQRKTLRLRRVKCMSKKKVHKIPVLTELRYGSKELSIYTTRMGSQNTYWQHSTSNEVFGLWMKLGRSVPNGEKDEG